MQNIWQEQKTQISQKFSRNKNMKKKQWKTQNCWIIFFALSHSLCWLLAVFMKIYLCDGVECILLYVGHVNKKLGYRESSSCRSFSSHMWCEDCFTFNVGFYFESYLKLKIFSYSYFKASCLLLTKKTARKKWGKRRAHVSFEWRELLL